MTALMIVHPTALVEEGVQLGEGCVVHAYASLKRGTILGEGVEVHSFAVIGDEPQDLHFDRAIRSGVRIGARTVIREHATIHRSTRPDTFTEVGDACLLMVSSHVAHDVRVGNHVVISNTALVAGHARVGDHAFLSGGVLIHQFCRVGESAMLGGGCRVSRDVPPFTLAVERNTLVGINLVGVRRRGFSSSAIRELKKAFHLVYDNGGNVRDNARQALESGVFQEAAARQFLADFGEGARGFVRPRRKRAESDPED
jgi:UDP-N-acetylglucosamine acyltransferase